MRGETQLKPHVSESQPRLNIQSLVKKMFPPAT